MAVFVYVLPVALFVVNLIIILAIRADDRKSRSLKFVKDTVASFRNETNATISRVQTTEHDAIENIEHKQKESLQTIADMQTALDQLAKHNNDLALLSGVCKSYEDALHKLKLQTEQAESRIAVVQKEVTRAEEVNSFVYKFNEDVIAIKAHMNSLKDDYNALVATTSQQMEADALSQSEKNKSMFSSFASELSSQRSEFSVFVQKELEEVEQKKNAYLQAVEDAHAAFDAQRDDIKASGDACNTAIEERMNELKQFVESGHMELEGVKNDAIALFETQKQDIIANAKSSLDGLDAKGDELKALVESESESLSARRDECIRDLDAEMDKIQGSTEECRKSLDEKSAELGVFTENESAKLATKRDECIADLDARNIRLNEDAEVCRQSLDEKSAAVKDFVDIESKNLEDVRDQCKADLEAKRIEVGNDAEECSKSLTDTTVQCKALLESKLLDVQGATDACKKALDDKCNEVNAFVKGESKNLEVVRDQCKADLDAKREEVSAFIAEEKKALELIKESFDVSFSNTREDFEEQKDVINQSIENGKSNLKAEHDQLLNMLTGHQTEIETALSALRDKTLKEFAERADAEEQAKKDMINNIDLMQNRVSANLSEMQTRADSLVAKSEDKRKEFDAYLGNAEKQLDGYADVIASNMQVTVDNVKDLHTKEQDAVAKDLEAYAVSCQGVLDKVCKDELDKLTAIYAKMTSAVETMLQTLAKRQSEVKEVTAMLSQGSSQNIANTVDRLQSLDAKIAKAEKTLQETQSLVTKAKEELLGSQEKCKQISEKVIRAQKQLRKDNGPYGENFDDEEEDNAESGPDFSQLEDVSYLGEAEDLPIGDDEEK